MLLLDSAGRIREATLGTFYGDGQRVPALLAGTELLAVGEVAGWRLLSTTAAESDVLKAASFEMTPCGRCGER